MRAATFAVLVATVGLVVESAGKTAVKTSDYAGGFSKAAGLGDLYFMPDLPIKAPPRCVDKSAKCWKTYSVNASALSVNSGTVSIHKQPKHKCLCWSFDVVSSYFTFELSNLQNFVHATERCPGDAIAFYDRPDKKLLALECGFIRGVSSVKTSGPSAIVKFERTTNKINFTLSWRAMTDDATVVAYASNPTQLIGVVLGSITGAVLSACAIAFALRRRARAKQQQLSERSSVDGEPAMKMTPVVG